MIPLIILGLSVVSVSVSLVRYSKNTLPAATRLTIEDPLIVRRRAQAMRDSTDKAFSLKKRGMRLI